MARETVTEYLAEHPRMMGVLFAAGLLVVQAGSVAANVTTGNNGP